MAAAVITTKILGDAFMGISTLRWKDTSSKLTATQSWDKEVPIGLDTCEFQQGDVSFQKYYIHGMARAFHSTPKAGDITMSFEVPSIDEDTTGWLGKQMTDVPVSMEDEVDGVAGTWVPIGKGLSLNLKKLSGMAMVISEDKMYAIVIKNLVGYSSLIMNASASTKPIGYKVSFSLEGITEDTDGDVVFLKWTPTV